MTLKLVAIAIAFATSIACELARGEPAAHLLERSHMTMGSELRVSAWTTSDSTANEAMNAVFREFDRLDALMSVWKDGSDIERLNAAAGDQPVRVSAEVREVVRAAHQVSEWTGGRFDVTFGALSGLWKFDHDQDNQIPDRAEVQKRLPLIDYRRLKIDD